MTARPGWPRRAVRWIGGLRGPAGSEQEMSFNRLLFALFFAAYLPATDADWVVRTCPILIAWVVCALGIALHGRLRPGPHAPRRAFALVADTGLLSWYLHVGGAEASPFFTIYLWVALGNGFRFGNAWLLAAMTAFVAGFGTVVATTPYWQGHGFLAAGLLLGPVVLALYAMTLIRKLSKARALAEQASDAKSRFLAGVSHELRTPLNAIIGMGGLLRGTRLDREQQDMIRTVEGAARSLLSLINRLLDFSRIEAGVTATQAEPFEPAALLAEVRDLLSAQAREKGLLLRLHVSSRVPQMLVCDPTHLRDILLNLGGNAVKFTRQGSVTLALDATPGLGTALTLRVEVSDTGIGIAPEAQQRIFERFTQAHEGIGRQFGGTGLGLAICEGLARLLGGEIGVRSRVGEGSTFWVTVPAQAVPAAAPPPLPAGLGAVLVTVDPAAAGPVAAQLALAGLEVTLRPLPNEALAARWPGPDHPVHVVTLHEAGQPPGTEVGDDAALPVLAIGGRAAESLPDVPQRALAVTWLPDLPSEAMLRRGLHLAHRLGMPAAEAPAEPEAAPATPPPIGLRVLVADDNRVNRQVVEKILTRDGHVAVLVEDGDQALEALESDAFDVVLMDMNMPGTDGLDATRQWRFMERGKSHLPIIGLTADATPAAAERCRAAGMDACLVKPITPAELSAAVVAQVTAAAAAAPPDKGAATPITEHPRYRAAPPGPALDPETLESLVALGGASFVDGLIQDFLAEAAEVMPRLEESVATGDAARFRAAAHNLRSGASNIGARGVAELCAAAERVPSPDLRVAGSRHVAQLASELARVRAARAQASAGAGR